MRNRALHDALREFALESAAILSDDQRSGAELEFEVIEEKPRGGPPLYRYVPLTERYIADRWHRLCSSPTCGPAASALGAGASQYLRVNGMRGDEAEPALRAMLERLYEDATSFAFPEERFEAVYADVEQTLFRDTTPTVVVAALHGVDLESDRIEVGEGLSLLRQEGFDGPAELFDEPGALCLLERDCVPGDPPLSAEASMRFRGLELGLRLYKPGGVRLGPLGWTRAADGRWQPVDLGCSGDAARGEPMILMASEEPELGDFLDTVARSRHGGAVAWALARFEMGCTRVRDAEALSDYLLALRALLDASSETGQASLSLRLAALCAEEHERRLLQRRVELALALERYVMAGGRDVDYVESLGSESPRMLVSEMERHLRALLRDVLCGYLDPDLKSIADDILLKAPEQPAPEPEPALREGGTIAARDLRREEPVTDEIEALESATLRVRRGGTGRFVPAAKPVAEPEPPPPPEPVAAEPQPEPEPEPEEAWPPPELEDDFEPVHAAAHLDGVTPSADWDDFSAPV